MKSIRRIQPYLSERRRHIVVGLLALIIVDILQLLIPRVIKRAVDALTLFGATPGGLMTFAAIIVGIGVLIGGFRYIWRRCLLGASRRVEEGLRNDLFAHLQTLSAGYFDQARTGDLMAHATNDIQQIRMATGMGMVALNDAVILGAAAIGFMAYIHVQLTLLVLIPMPLIVFGTRFFSRRMHLRYQRVQKSFSDLTEVVRERFAGIRVIKAYDWGAASTAAVELASDRYVQENISLVKVTGLFMPMMVLLTNLSMAIVLYVGGVRTLTLAITPGDLVAFISYLGLLTWPMMAMGWVTNLIQRGKASLDRIDAVLAAEPEIRDRPGARRLSAPPSRLHFDEVEFRYRPEAPAILSGIRLMIHAGESVGIIGPPGSGKSTLLHLIPRLYEATQGAIRLDGVDVRKILLGDLRANIALSSQEPFLFSGTIRENLTLGAEVNGKEIQKAVEKAALSQTLAALPGGIETLVGERGVILSGGQKQRIALARALIRPAPILLLDDPISQVDSGTARTILDTLRSLGGARTLLIVSHRMSAVRFADRILTLEGGRITETGTHDDLIAAGGYYARTWRMQALEEEGDHAAAGLEVL
ncbi:MAG: ABC transporter ATP-binding protein [Desulfobacterales bacterium]